jgi:hypothetical protein
MAGSHELSNYDLLRKNSAPREKFREEIIKCSCKLHSGEACTYY